MRLLSLYIPEKFKKEKIIQLYKLTSGVFNDYPIASNSNGSKAPDTCVLRTLTYREILKKYADYTTMAVNKLLYSRHDINKIKESLFDKSYKLGQEIRNDYNIKTFEDIRFIIKIIYKIVKIDSNLVKDRATGSKELEVKHCFFADYYSADVCSVMSSVDEGIVAGVSGCRQMQFVQRITEGEDHCRAKLE
jgi:hypothetical protein